MMIPKSVSVSMRIAALGAVLLIPAWGWAETGVNIACNEINGKMTNCGPVYQSGSQVTGIGLGVIDFQRGPIATCDIDYKNCHILEPESFPCYQRMREAMKVMDKHLTTAREAQKAKTLPVDDITLWYQTYQDCVEGR